MSKSATTKARGGGFSLTFPTFILLTTGAIVFYFASQAFTPENAHLARWGLAALGGFLGWATGTLADRFGSRTVQHKP